MLSAPQVAIIIISHNTRDLLLDCLASVIESTQARQVECVVVDNASTDGSADAALAACPQVTVIRNAENRGFAAACNQAIRQTHAPMILLLNSDARLNAEAFDALTSCLLEHERCAAAGCRVVNDQGVAYSARNFLTPFNQALELLSVKLGRRWRRTHHLQLDRRGVDCSVDWLEGACLMLRRKAMDEAGVFDEAFFMYSEDEDLCFRLRQRGWTVCFSAQAEVWHRGGASSAHNAGEMLVHFYASQMRFLLKHRGRASAALYRFVMRVTLALKLCLRPRRAGGEMSERLRALRQAAALVRATHQSE
ncbi:MAG: glycosyltransferase family 2 protein [Blastocatellia bacterium]